MPISKSVRAIENLPSFQALVEDKIALDQRHWN